MNDQNRELTAYHEAGHAVLWWHFGIRLKEVTIKPTDDSLGSCIVHGDPMEIFHTDERPFPDEATTARQTLIKIKIMSLLAGGLAEKIRFPATDLNNSICWQDHETAKNLIIRFVPDHETEDLVRQTQELLTAYWFNVSALAQLLLKHITVTGEDAEMILDDPRPLLQIQHSTKSVPPS
ncbi:MAG: hypothetical protein HQL52_19750 [Magnetococcales bacterium]|nr:hypothetical protein [Magnetococcales bacterium]